MRPSAILATLLAASSALGQPNTGVQQTVRIAPAPLPAVDGVAVDMPNSNPAATALLVDPKRPKWLTRSNRQNWKTWMRVDVTPGEISGRVATVPPFELNLVSFIFPVVTETSACEIDPHAIQSSVLMGSGSMSVAKGAFTIDEPPVPDRPELISKSERGKIYSAGQRLGKWSRAFTTNDSTPTNYSTAIVQFYMEEQATTYDVKLDEKAAARIGWPQKGWPEDVAACLQPQMFIDFGPTNAGEVKPYDPEPVGKLLKSWITGDIKAMQPLNVAKLLCGKVVDNFRVTNGSRVLALNGGYQGIRPIGAAQAALSMVGADLDMASLLTAVYRRAGLPARLVVGWDTFEDVGRGETDRRTGFVRGVGDLRFWVEFYLYDENANEGSWVIADPVAIRRERARVPAFDQPWKYFGTHDEMRWVVPLSFHFHPPTSVRSYGNPCLWGWLTGPGMINNAFAAFSVNATSGSNRVDPPKPGAKPGQGQPGNTKPGTKPSK